jgi:hypothetical protein
MSLKLGTDSQRPWLILSDESHPFEDEQYIAVAISTSEYVDSIPLDSEDWVVGGVPRKSFVSPWAVHSPRVKDLVAWQGRVTDALAETVVDDVVSYLRKNAP